MSYQNRKSVARAFLILMLTAIISFTIILFAINQFFARAGQEVDEQACRASILTRVKSTIKLVKVVELNPFPIICKTQNKVIKGNEEQVKEQISYLSARCWWMFLNGEYGNIFNKLQLTSDQKCFICYIFTIDDKNIKISGEELMEYMDEHYYITKGGEGDEEEGVTYLDYIQRWKGKGAITTSKDIEFESVGDKGEIYSIYFISPDLTLWGGWLSAILGNKELKEMNVIYIEQSGVNTELENDCKVLESI